MDISKFQYYRNLLKSYPDVVTLPTFREMLGGISDSAARRLIKKNFVRHFCINQEYQIPKLYIIEYLISDAYKEHCKRFKNAI